MRSRRDTASQVARATPPPRLAYHRPLTRLVRFLGSFNLTTKRWMELVWNLFLAVFVAPPFVMCLDALAVSWALATECSLFVRNRLSPLSIHASKLLPHFAKTKLY